MAGAHMNCHGKHLERPYAGPAHDETHGTCINTPHTQQQNAQWLVHTPTRRHLQLGPSASPRPMH